MSTPTCSQCYRPMTYTDKGWTCQHRETQPPTLTFEDELRQRLGSLGYNEWKATVAWILGHIDREREAAAKDARHKAYNQIMKATNRQFPAPMNGSPMELSRDGEVFNAVTKSWENAVNAALDTPNQQETKHE